MLDEFPDTFTFLQIHYVDDYATTWGDVRSIFYTDVGGAPTTYYDGVLRRASTFGYSIALADYNTRRAVPTDVTIRLTATPVSGQTYSIGAIVCVEPLGTPRTLRVYVAQVLDYWPSVVTYSRNGFKQAAIPIDVTLGPGECQTILSNLTFDAESWANQEDIVIIAWAQEPQSSSPPSNRAEVFQAAIMRWPLPIGDCNSNGVADECETACGLSGCNVPGCGENDDCNFNYIPDECELAGNDCNGNGVLDICDIAGGTSPDCNASGLPDECELSGNDCDANLVPDSCDVAELISVDPQNVSVCLGSTAQFSVSVSQSPVTYLWKKNGVALSNGGDIGGVTTDTLSIANVDSSDAANYTCTVTHGCIVATSAPATLDILVAASISSHPVARLNKCEGTAASFSVTAGGSAPFSYQWYENGLEISGAISAILTISSVTLAQDEFAYTCRVTNACGTALSNAGVLNVVYITFTDQPDDVCGEVGSTVSTSADALSGGGAIIWQWWKGASQVSGQSTRFLTLNNVQPANEGAYRARAIITSPTFCEEYSAEAIVLVGNCCTTPGDVDGDGDFDLLDVSAFTLCFGPGAGLIPGCECANVALDLARDVDLADWSALESLLDGPQ